MCRWGYCTRERVVQMFINESAEVYLGWGLLVPHDGVHNREESV